jgi:hypothetical protein
MDPDQHAHARSRLIRIHAVRLQTLYQVEKLIANSMDPDQTGSIINKVYFYLFYNRFVWKRNLHFDMYKILQVMHMSDNENNASH